MTVEKNHHRLTNFDRKSEGEGTSPPQQPPQQPINGGATVEMRTDANQIVTESQIVLRQLKL